LKSCGLEKFRKIFATMKRINTPQLKEVKVAAVGKKFLGSSKSAIHSETIV
jgi:hypothetical protein